MKKRVLPLTMGAMLVVVVVFLATRQLTAASQYAAIGGFLVAFAGLGLSVWRQRQDTGADETEDARPNTVAAPFTSTEAVPAAGTTVIGSHNNVIDRPKRKVKIHTVYGPDPDRKRRR
ncbi:hypothetical protein [Micromonospora tulbaghiae]|uniref:hypothetical protein n=1 Tax=Micromonospora tulbaghiae TaxID=479978 RepID=UPI003403AB45